jgi:ABC-type Fe3+-siderophore transport system permease subunit
VPVRDFLISGGASLGTGAALLAGRGLDPHGVFGIAGGGAIIVAVFLLIAAFGYRHDARERAERR